MLLLSYFDNLEPASEDAEIWRFLPIHFFEDLMANEELHFTRADCFTQDEQEGIPPEDYLRRVLNLQRFVLDDEMKLNHHLGTLSQDRLRYFVLCWHLHRHETVEMWQGFARTGVAIRSRYDLLKKVMSAMLDTTHLGLMRYGTQRLHQMGRYNVWQFINTKRHQYAGEREVRAIIEGPFAGDSRHFDFNNHAHSRPLAENPPPSWLQCYKRRRIDVSTLVTGVVVSPFASPEVFETARHWVEDVKKLNCEVRRSNLTVS
jgi:hypothetical protein